MHRPLQVLALAGLAATALAACSPDDTEVENRCEASHTLHWDLTEGHTIDDVDWPGGETGFQLNDGVDVLLQLPGGAVFDECAHAVSGLHHDGVIGRITAAYPAATTGDAYVQASVLADNWNIDLVNLDDWFERRTAQSEAGNEDFTDTAVTDFSHTEPLGGPCGPSAVIEILDSRDPDRPARVNFSWTWPGHGDTGTDAALTCP